jgi:Polysaccharide lyase family 4, domain II
MSLDSKTKALLLPIFLLAVTAGMESQTAYQVVSVSNGGTIAGAVKWSGPMPRGLTVPVNKDPQICDPDGNKSANLDRLIVSSEGGVANAVVFLRNVSSGKAMILPEPRRTLDQRRCQYEPHILLVPQSAALSMKSSDHVLHTIHMDGAASFNLPFPFVDQTVARNMETPGLVNLRCNGGHVWMNAEMMVVQHPYYAVTDESGHFELDNVPPGKYQLVAWHEGWHVMGRESALDVFTQKSVQRVVFAQPKTWEESVVVAPNTKNSVNFTISDK